MDLDCYSDLVDDIVSFCKNGNVGEDNASNKSEGSEDCYMPDEKRLNKPGIREELDAHVCEGLFRTFRKRDEDPEKVIPNSRIDTLFLGVAMMEAGATISRDNLEYLRSIIRAYRPSRKDTKEPGKFAHGMYNTGQAQMVTAVDLYQAGTPRNFHADCCFHCGKFRADIKKDFIKCPLCNTEFWCDEDCRNHVSTTEHEEECFTV